MILNWKNSGRISFSINYDFWLLSIILVAIISRLWQIGFQEPWLDELSTLQVSDPTLTFKETDTLIMTREGFPHLYFLSLKILSGIFGHSIVISRLFSFFFGILTIFYCYKLAKLLWSQQAGYIAAFLMTFNDFHLFYSQEGRCYTMLTFFALLSIYRLFIFFEDQSWKNTVILGIATGLIVNSHPIGLLNIAVVFSALGVFFYFRKFDKAIFIKSAVVGLIALLLFLPVYPLFAKLSQIKSFWIPPANFATIKTTFIEFFGNSEMLLLVYLSALLVYLAFGITKIIKASPATKERQKLIYFVIILWLLFNVGYIFYTSFVNVSIILGRYFSAALPVFTLIFAYLLSQVKFTWLKAIAMLLVLFVFCSNIYKTKYYSSVRKTQWDTLAKEIIKRNSANHRIFGTYGFTSNILFKGTPSYNLLQESTLNDCLALYMNSNRPLESFWFFDGNFRPFQIDDKTREFLSKNYILKDEVNLYDCYAVHFVLKVEKEPAKTDSGISLNSFEGGFVENTGNRALFQNGSIISNSIQLKSGEHVLKIDGYSTPRPKLKGENARIKVFFNDRLLKTLYLSEDPKKMTNTIKFSQPIETMGKFKIEFDNDLQVDQLDRNAVFVNIKLDN